MTLDVISQVGEKAYGIGGAPLPTVPTEGRGIQTLVEEAHII